jgi:hypothetical protein
MGKGVIFDSSNAPGQGNTDSHTLLVVSPVFLPSGKRLHNYGKSPFSVGKSTISMAIFKLANCWSLPEATWFQLSV